MQKHAKSFLLAFATVALTWAGAANAKVEGDTIILGAALSFTGKYKTNGQHTKNGYELAVKRINDFGGVKVADKSYKLKIVYYDDESTPARGAQLAERLIKQDGIKFMLGPYSSGLTKAIAPVTEKNKIPMIEGNGASRSLFNKGYKYCSRCCPPPSNTWPKRLTWPGSRPRTPRASRSPSRWRTILSPRTSVPGWWKMPRDSA